MSKKVENNPLTFSGFCSELLDESTRGYNMDVTFVASNNIAARVRVIGDTTLLPEEQPDATFEVLLEPVTLEGVDLVRIMYLKEEGTLHTIFCTPSAELVNAIFYAY